MKDFLVDLFFGFIPQMDDDARKMYIWRWKAVVMTFIAIALGSYAANILPIIKPPYAIASTVTSGQNNLGTTFQNYRDQTDAKLRVIEGQLNMVMSQNRESRISSLNTDLIEATRYKCRASATEGDKSTLSFWTTRLETLKQNYRDLTGDPWPNLDCKSF